MVKFKWRVPLPEKGKEIYYYLWYKVWFVTADAHLACDSIQEKVEMTLI